MNELARRTREGHVPSGARVIRLLEDGDPAGVAALRALYADTGRAHVVGVTGPPGAGKSTLVDALVATWRGRDLRVAVIAIDPTSPFSGGAILGDRIRMQRHATDPGVFIRSMATRGRHGGLARATFDASAVLDAMGYDVVVVETVGVGQEELEIVDLAHTTLVVNVPGLGDEIQALKAGLFEVGEVFVLNKADRPGADATEKQLVTMLHLRDADATGWTPPLVRTVAAAGEGVEALADACAAHRTHLAGRQALHDRAAARSERFLVELLRERAARRLLDRAAASPSHADVLAAVRERRLDPYTAADRLLAAFGPGEASETDEPGTAP